MTEIANFIHSHTTLAIALSVAFAVFAYLKPKHVFKLAAALAVMGIIVYVIVFLVNLTSTGIDEATKFTDSPQIKLKN